MNAKRYGWLVAALLVACGNNKPPKDASDEPKINVDSDSGDSDSADSGNGNTKGGKSAASTDVGAEPDEGGLAFDEEFAQRVLKRGERKAKECHKTIADMPSGEGDVDVVFDGPKGRVVDVKIGANWADASQAAQSCLKNSWVGEIIPPFDGQKTVTYTLTLPAAGK